ncbi:MAG: hypothetical protein IK066_02730 [Kiritimatiellae bacterium]|nr:hypothetical protein [Kiritimatiellia bacterium]
MGFIWAISETTRPDGAAGSRTSQTGRFGEGACPHAPRRLGTDALPVLFTLAVALAAEVAWGNERAGAWLSADDGGAWVREGFRFGEDAGRNVRELRWEGVPEGLDEGSLGVWNVLRPWAVRGWRREGADMVVELAEPMSTGMGYSLTYRTRGMWAEEDGAGGWRVRNETGREYPGARVAVAGRGEPRWLKPWGGAGIVDANPDAALSALWTGRESGRGAGTWREWPGTVDVPGHGAVEEGNGAAEGGAGGASEEAPAGEEARRAEEGPVAVSVLNEMHQAYARAERWLAAEGIGTEEDGEDEGASGGTEEWLWVLAGEGRPGLYEAAAALARGLDAAGTEWVFLPDGRAVEWRKALVRIIVAKQRVDARSGGGYWAEGGEKRRSTRRALEALEIASGEAAPGGGAWR